MLWLVHGFIVLLYGAAALSLGLPRALPDIDLPLAYGAGAIGFLLAALLHQTVARAFACRSVERAPAALGKAQDRAADKLAALESDIARLAEVLEKGGLSENSAEVVSEMRIMRGLLAQLSTRTGARAPKPASRPGRAPTAIVDATEPVPVIVPQTLNDDEVMAITQQALHDNRIDLYVQPMVTLPGRDVRVYETFSRIRHEDGSIILPDEYLRLATKMGLIGTIDNMLVSQEAQASAPVVIADLKAAMKKSGVDLIAEKVGTEQIVVDLLNYDIDYGQGYLFGEPQPSQMTSA